MPESLLSAHEVAQYLKVNIETIYNWIRKAVLPASKIGGQGRVRETEHPHRVDTRMATGIQRSSATAERRVLCSTQRTTDHEPV